MENQDFWGKFDKFLAGVLGLMVLSACVSPALARNLFWGIYVLFALRIIVRPSFLRPLGEIRWFLYAAGAIILMVAVQSVYGGRFMAVIKNSDYYGQLAVLLPVMIFLLVREKAYIHRLLDFLAAGVTVASLDLLRQGIFHAHKLKAGGIRAESLIGHFLNTSAMYIALIPLLTIFALSGEEKPLRRKLYAAAAVIALAGSVFTGTRGCYLAIVFELVVIIGYCLRRNFKKMLAVFCAAVLLAGGLCFFIPALNRRVSTIGNLKEFSQYQRLLMWDSAFNMWKDYPLMGVGMGNYAKRYQTEYIHPEARAKEPFQWHAHNCYLHLLAEDGLFGFLLYAFAFGSLLLWGWRHRHSRYGLTGFVATLGLLFYATNDYIIFHGNSGMRVFWLLQGFCISGQWLEETAIAERETK